MVDIFKEDVWNYINSKYPRLRNYCSIFGIKTAKGAKIFLMEHEYDDTNESIKEFVRLLQFIDYCESYVHNGLLEAMSSNKDVEITKSSGNIKKLSLVGERS